MKVLNLLTSGGVGGIEVLCRDIGKCSNVENKFVFLYGKGQIFEQMCSLHMDVRNIDFGGKLSVKRTRKLLEEVRDCDIVVVHHDDPFLQMHYLLTAYCYPSKKYISMVHHCYSLNGDDNGYGWIKEKLRNTILKRMFHRSDKILFVSKAGMESYVPYFRIDENKAGIVYNGISQKLIEMGKGCCKGTVRERKIHLYYIGRLVRLKGVDLLIKAIVCLDGKYDLDLVIVGDGKDREKLEQIAGEYHLWQKVVFKGFQEDVTPYLKEADLFIYPSRTEIFGISLVEAMAFGNICIANSVGGIPEIIEDGKNGILNPTNDVEGLTSAIERGIKLLSDEEKAEEIRHNAKMTAAAFCIENTIQRLNQIYMGLSW